VLAGSEIRLRLRLSLSNSRRVELLDQDADSTQPIRQRRMATIEPMQAQEAGASTAAIRIHRSSSSSKGSNMANLNSNSNSSVQRLGIPTTSREEVERQLSRHRTMLSSRGREHNREE
jgi:hypothetical protein